MITVLNAETDKKKYYRSSHLAQELSRPTPPDVFLGIKTGYHFLGFDGYLQLFREYCDDNGHMPPRVYEIAGVALGEWCRFMKTLHTNGKLSEERIRLLPDAGFQWKNNKTADSETGQLFCERNSMPAQEYL